MKFSTLRALIANFEDRNIWANKYAIANEFGLLAIVYADHEADALDEAADSGLLDCLLLDISELEDRFSDDHLHLGNFSYPYATDYLRIARIN